METPTMLEYIKDQPRALIASLDNREEFCEPMRRIFQKHTIRKIYIVGSGTSYHAALAIRQFFETYIPVEVTVCIPTVFTNYERLNNHNCFQPSEVLVIAISQSGTSLSTIHAVQKAKEEGYQSVALTEDLNSLITKEADHVIHLTCGKERIPIETRGYTVTVLTGFLWAIDIARYTGALMKHDFEKLLDAARNTLASLSQVIEESECWYEKHKEELLEMKKGAISGYGLNYVTAQEAALKLYETFHRPVLGFEMEEMIHGFEMAFDQDQYIFMIASQDAELERMDQFQDFLADLTNHIFRITCEDIVLTDRDLKLTIHPLKDLSAIVYILPFQILAAKNCENIGYDTAVYPHKRRSFSHKRD